MSACLLQSYLSPNLGNGDSSRQWIGPENQNHQKLQNREIVRYNEQRKLLEFTDDIRSSYESLSIAFLGALGSSGSLCTDSNYFLNFINALEMCEGV